MTRAEWLASLQTFDKVWLPSSGGVRGSIVTVLVMADGKVVDLHSPTGEKGDLRQWPVEPVPEAPWGRCPACGKVSAEFDHLADGRCLDCRYVPKACPGGCKTREEHDAAVREQRVRCGLAPSDADPVH